MYIYIYTSRERRGEDRRGKRESREKRYGIREKRGDEKRREGVRTKMEWV